MVTLDYTKVQFGKKKDRFSKCCLEEIQQFFNEEPVFLETDVEEIPLEQLGRCAASTHSRGREFCLQYPGPYIQKCITLF